MPQKTKCFFIASEIIEDESPWTTAILLDFFDDLIILRLNIDNFFCSLERIFILRFDVT